MSTEMRFEGLDVAPGVLETIVTLAATEVEGVACVDCSGLAGLMQKAGRTKSVEVSLADDGGFAVTVHMSVGYGRPLRAIAADVQHAVADALESQTGHEASNVDVFIDAIVFPQ
ncbi:MAG: Asp23/Gls24 family envelope stress response protein [Coriobacteriia bacterium]|nr:Asp23/Gls24 family envelope stress response protein [Coriobacteriia bacterium]